MIRDSIEKAAIEDIPAIASIHKDQFSDHFLGQYPLAVIRAYYKQFLSGTIFYVYKESESIKGFILGGEASTLAELRNAFLRQNLMMFIAATLIRPRLYTSALSRFFARMRNSKKPKGQTSSADNPLLILSIAVSKESLGSGVANKLYGAFIKDVKKGSEIRLFVRKNNKRAIRFYEKSGFELLATDGEELILKSCT